MNVYMTCIGNINPNKISYAHLRLKGIRSGTCRKLLTFYVQNRIVDIKVCAVRLCATASQAECGRKAPSPCQEDGEPTQNPMIRRIDIYEQVYDLAAKPDLTPN